MPHGNSARKVAPSNARLEKDFDRSAERHDPDGESGKQDKMTMTGSEDAAEPRTQQHRSHQNQQTPSQETPLSFSSFRALNDLDRKGIIDDKDFLHWVDENVETKPGSSVDQGSSSSGKSSHEQKLDPLSASAIALLAGNVRPRTQKEVVEQAEDPSSVTPLELEKHGKVEKVTPSGELADGTEVHLNKRRGSGKPEDIRKSVTAVTVEYVNDKPTYVVHVDKKGKELKKDEVETLKAQIAEEIDMDNWEARIRESHERRERRHAEREAKKKQESEGTHGRSKETNDDGWHTSSTLPLSFLNPGFLERKEADERLLMTENAGSSPAQPLDRNPRAENVEPMSKGDHDTDPEDPSAAEDHVAEMVSVARRKFQDRLRNINEKAIVHINVGPALP